jgi:SnoaL-like domain
MTLQLHGAPFSDTELEEFVKRCLDGLSHQVQGNSAPFLEVWSHADDVRTHLLGASRSLDSTHLTLERLLTTASGELAVTVVLEHMRRNVDEEPHSRTLRTTQAYRREDGEWRLILRHANPVTPADASRECALAAE